MSKPTYLHVFRILVVSDTPELRGRLAAAIRQLPALMAVKEADELPGTFSAGDHRSFDLVIVDLADANEPVLRRMHELTVEGTAPPVLTIVPDNPPLARRAFRAGVMAMVGADEMEEQVEEAIRRVVNGEFYVSSSVEKWLRTAAESREHEVSDGPLV